jgi:modified peptide precursor CbpA
LGFARFFSLLSTRYSALYFPFGTQPRGVVFKNPNYRKTPPPNPKGGDCLKQKRKEVIAYRKSCAANGTGLSHYILMDKKAK